MAIRTRNWRTSYRREFTSYGTVLSHCLAISLTILLATQKAHGFSPLAPSPYSCTITSRATVSQLWSTPPPRKRRRPRRELPKRRRKKNPEWSSSSPTTSNNSNNHDELRPLIRSEAREQGVDYWIDPYEMERYQEAQRRTRLVGQVPDEKLWNEVLRPYKENWIGLFSVLIVVMTVIVSNFPELLQSPVISIPDL